MVKSGPNGYLSMINKTATAETQRERAYLSKANKTSTIDYCPNNHPQIKLDRQRSMSLDIKTASSKSFLPGKSKHRPIFSQSNFFYDSKNSGSRNKAKYQLNEGNKIKDIQFADIDDNFVTVTAVEVEAKIRAEMASNITPSESSSTSRYFCLLSKLPRNLSISFSFSQI